MLVIVNKIISKLLANMMPSVQDGTNRTRKSNLPSASRLANVFNWEKNKTATVVQIDCTDKVALSKLSGMGIEANSTLRVRERCANFCTVQIGNRTVGVSKGLAESILLTR